MPKLDIFIGNVNRIIINPLIEFLFALAVVYFLYGMVVFLMKQSNDENKTTGKSHMIWGVVGMTIMIGVYTILGVILSTFHITDVNPEQGTVNITIPK